MNLRPTCRASSRYPVLKAGCEQQVCLSSNWTSQPTRRNTSTLLTPTLLHSWSTRHVTKSETSIRFDCASETCGSGKTYDAFNIIMRLHVGSKRRFDL